MNALPYVLLAGGLALNLYATLILLRSRYYDARQKAIQSGIIWLLPFAGAVLVLSLARNEKPARVTTDLSDHYGLGTGDRRQDNYSVGEAAHDGADGGGGGD